MIGGIKNDLLCAGSYSGRHIHHLCVRLRTKTHTNALATSLTVY